MPKYIMALDQGTTSSRAILFDDSQNIVELAQREISQIYPREGWVEHDAMEIWSTQYSVMMEVLAKSGVDAHDIAAIGITNQRETAVVWDKESGRPIPNALVWQCRRTAPAVDKLIADGLSDMIREKTGLIPDAYFSATKVQWILDHVEGARERAERGELLFGTVDSWLLWKLTGRCTPPTARTPRAPCCTTSTRWTGTTICWRCSASPGARCPRCVRRRAFTVPPTSAARTCPSRASRAISRPRCSDRAALTADRRRTRTARAAFC